MKQLKCDVGCCARTSRAPFARGGSRRRRRPRRGAGGVRIDGGNLVVVGGQNGTDAAGEIVSNDLGEQAKQAFRNVLTVLADAVGDQRHVARLNICLQVAGDVTAGYQAAAEVWGTTPITVLQVSAFSRPEVMVEIAALAVVP